MQRALQSWVGHTAAVHNKADRSVLDGRRKSDPHLECAVNTWILLPGKNLPPRLYTNLLDCKANRASH